MTLHAVTADQIKPEPPPSCPDCGKPMEYYGGTAGFICCGWKLLYRNGGWFDDKGQHVEDTRLNRRERDVTHIRSRRAWPGV